MILTKVGRIWKVCCLGKCNGEITSYLINITGSVLTCAKENIKVWRTNSKRETQSKNVRATCSLYVIHIMHVLQIMFSSLPVCNSSLNPGISLLLFLYSPVCHPSSLALPCHWLIWVICCLAKTGNETFHSSPVAAPLSKATEFLHCSPLPNELISCA